MTKGFKVQGYNFTGYGTTVYDTSTARGQMNDIVAGGGNAIAFIPEYYQDTIHSNTLYTTNITPSDNDVIAGIEAAEARGLSVMLKPHIDPLDGNWRAYLDPSNPTAWFASYKTMIVHYAEIAQESGAASLSIGCELRSMTGSAYRPEWLDIISAIRHVYDGKLTYSAEWSEASTLSFWDKLDEIGIDGYFPLANSDQSPTVRELEYSWTHGSVASWVNTALGGKSPLDYLHDLSAEYHKHVEFTEVGYRAIDGAATSPGDFAMDGTLDATAQANLYKALFDTFGSQGGHWFDGFYLWERRADNYSEPKDYHTEGRAAQAVIDKWYGMDNKGGHAPSTKMTLAGTLDNDTLMGGIGGTTILGGDGNDTITGGGGNDTIIGGDRETHVGTHSVVGLTAYCDSMNGVGAQFDVFLNGKRIGQDETSSAHSEAWQIGHYAFDAATPSDFKSLKIVFTNDDFGGGQDRNLYVTSISINGITIDLKNAINTQQPHSGTLYSDGSFSVDLRSLSSSLTPATTDDDVLRGGLGHDRLTGGAGDDIFVYKSLAEIAGDVITDFHPGHDLIDLHRIDANSHQNASQAFDWIGNHDFSHHAGELSERMDGANTVVLGDVDGDGRADFKLVLSGHLTLHNSDFVL